MATVTSYYVSLAQKLLALGEEREQLMVQLQSEYQSGMSRAIEDFKALKSGELSLDSLVVTDNGWEFMPPVEEVADAAS